jgi:DNA-binding transcriptional regulator LsrR (DeoR family)
MAEKVDIAVISIGEVSKSASLFEMGFLLQEDIHRVLEKGAVGDILGRFIDSQGKIIEDEIHDRVIGIPIETLKRSDQVTIGIAGGESKFEAVRAAVKGGFVNVLITDENNALRLCETV